MKKSLLALAVLASSGVAMAQSSVTLYGVADASVQKTSGKAGATRSSNTLALSTNNTMNNGNSRFGMRGVEDLGGGLKASFNFEAGVNLGSGAADASVFQRAAFIALDGSFGQVYAGRRLSPSFNAIVSYELTGAANYTALGNKFGFGNATRNSTYLAYTTPDMSGFKATVGTILKANNVAPNGTKTEFALTYNQGPLAAGLAYDTVSQTVGKSKRDGSVGARYDFGNFILAASYQNPSGVRKGFTLGGTAKLGTASLTLDIARDNGDKGSKKKSTDYVLEAKQPLSKRTFVYGVIYHATAVNGAGGNALNAVAAGGSNNSFGVGVRHNF